MANEAIELEQQDYPDIKGTLSGLAAYCRDLYTEYSGSSYRQEKLEKIADGRKRYHGDREPKTFPWPGCSNKSMGLDAIAIDNLEPRVKAQVVAEDDFVQVEPVGAEDIDNAEYVRETAHWCFKNNMKLQERVRPFAHLYLLDGTVDVLPIYTESTMTNLKRGLRPVFVDNLGNEIDTDQILGTPMEEMFLQMVMAGLITPTGEQEEHVSTSEERTFKVELDIIPLDQAFFPDTWENWDEMPYLRYIYPTLRELEDASEENGGPYKNISKDLVRDSARESSDHRDEEQERKGVRFSEYTYEVECMECYLKWRGEWTLATFVPSAGWLEIRRQKMQEVYPHGRKPVHRFRLFPEENESMGYGIPEKIEYYSTGVDDLYNQMIDSGTVEIIPWGFIPVAPGADTKKIEIYPGKLNEVGRDSVPFFPNIGVKSPQFINFIQMLMGFFERMVSLMDQTLGGDRMGGGRGTETLGGMSLIVQEGNIKHSYTGEGLQLGFARLLTDCFGLYARYMPLDAQMGVFENNGWRFEEIDVLRLQGQYDFSIHTSNSSANAMLNRREKLELYNMLAQNPTINFDQITEDLLKAYGIKDLENYQNPAYGMMMQALAQAPEIAQMVQQYLQQKQMQARQQQIAGEAQSNVQRQQIERQVERQAPQFEQDKLVDQAQESVQRNELRQGFQQQADAQRLMAALGMG
jgi:hypothetical protein